MTFNGNSASLLIFTRIKISKAFGFARNFDILRDRHRGEGSWPLALGSWLLAAGITKNPREMSGFWIF